MDEETGRMELPWMRKLEGWSCIDEETGRMELHG